MTLGQFILTAFAGAVAGGVFIVGFTIVLSKIDVWKARRGGRWPWEKD